MTIQPDQQKEQESKSRKMKPKQIAALACAILLVGVFVGASVAVCLNPDDSGRLFAGWLGVIIGLPILLWLLVWSLLQLKKRRVENRPPH